MAAAPGTIPALAGHGSEEQGEIIKIKVKEEDPIWDQASFLQKNLSYSRELPSAFNVSGSSAIRRLLDPGRLWANSGNPCRLWLSPETHTKGADPGIVGAGTAPDHPAWGAQAWVRSIILRVARRWWLCWRIWRGSLMNLDSRWEIGGAIFCGEFECCGSKVEWVESTSHWLLQIWIWALSFDHWNRWIDSCFWDNNFYVGGSWF